MTLFFEKDSNGDVSGAVSNGAIIISDRALFLIR